MITKYGYGTVGFITVIIFIVIVASIFLQNNIIKYILFGAGITFMIFTLYFFRDPERTSPVDKNLIVSPADGKVLSVVETEEDKFINGPAWKVSIFMSPLNVHVNRIPMSGKVEYLKYHKGEYLMAFHDKADERNERNEIGISGNMGKILFTQVAGFIARRIVSDLQPGQEVIKGERFGMIKFGSRSDVYVSKDFKVNVKQGDIVAAGETILFEIGN